MYDRKPSATLEWSVVHGHAAHWHGDRGGIVMLTEFVTEFFFNHLAVPKYVRTDMNMHDPLHKTHTDSYYGLATKL